MTPFTVYENVCIRGADMLSEVQRANVVRVYEQTSVVYVDPSIPKTNPLDLLVDLVQCFRPMLQSWNLDSVELLRAILNVCDIFPYADPQHDHELNSRTSEVHYVMDQVEDVASFLWHSRIAHARSLAHSLAQRLCHVDDKFPSNHVLVADSDIPLEASETIVLSRLEIMVHPYPVRNIVSIAAGAAKSAHEVFPLLNKDRGSPLHTLAFAIYALAPFLKRFSVSTAETLQVASYFTVESQLGRELPYVNSPIKGLYSPYWEIDHENLLSLTQFLYVYIRDLCELNSTFLTGGIGRRILRGLVIYAGHKQALYLANEPKDFGVERPASPVPPPPAPVASPSYHIESPFVEEHLESPSPTDLGLDLEEEEELDLAPAPKKIKSISFTSLDRDH